MSDYILSCCSTADLSREHFNSRNISYACFHYFLDGVEHLDDLGESMPFYSVVSPFRSGALPIGTISYIFYENRGNPCQAV